MIRFWQYFIRGVLTLLPFGLTIYVLILFLKWSEATFASTFTWALGDAYIPGMGLGFGVIVICLLGFLISHETMGSVFSFIEVPFKNVPIVKSIYSAIKNLADYFSPDGDHTSRQVVSVHVPNLNIQMIGFLTRSDLRGLPQDSDKTDRVAVYFPMSYQIGGYTAFVPRAWVTKIDMPVEIAMRSALTAWMPSRE
jgi:uncharacterized membrane protein